MPAHGRRRLIATATAGTLALGVAGAAQGDDDATEAQSGATLTITASGTERAPRYAVAPSAPAGPTTITLRNTASGEVDGQLVRVEGERTDAEVVAELRKAEGSRRVAPWFQPAGGVGTTARGRSASVTQVLRPGAHYLIGGTRASPAVTKFVVVGPAQGSLPKTRGAIFATEYSFRARKGTPLRAGRQSIEFRNTGREFHHFLAARLKRGSTLADARRYLSTERGSVPFASGNGPETTVLDGGESQIVPTTLRQGRYAFFCFVADRAGGPPHVAKGMVSQVRVR